MAELTPGFIIEPDGPVVGGEQKMKSVTIDEAINAASFAGQAGKIIVINGTEDGFNLVDIPSQQVLVFAYKNGLSDGDKFWYSGTENAFEGIALFTGTISTVGVNRTDGDAATLEILVNGSPEDEFVSNSQAGQIFSTSIAVTAGDTLEARNKSGGNEISNASVTMCLVSS